MISDSSPELVTTCFEKGSLKSEATKAELSKFRAAARATAIKDHRVNIRLSSGDLQDIQVKALQEGMPYQTLIASVLHKYVTRRLAERDVAPRLSMARRSVCGQGRQTDESWLALTRADIATRSISWALNAGSPFDSVSTSTHKAGLSSKTGRHVASAARPGLAEWQPKGAD